MDSRDILASADAERELLKMNSHSPSARTIKSRLAERYYYGSCSGLYSGNLIDVYMTISEIYKHLLCYNLNTILLSGI